MEKLIEQIPYKYSLAPLQGVTIEEEAPFDGYIKEVTIHWPGGCNALVEVKVTYYHLQFCPREGYLALDAVTPTFPFNVKVEKSLPIVVEMRNGDAVNSHTITAIVLVEGITQ